MDQTDNTSPSPTYRELFISFLLLGMMGFGGVLPLAKRMLLEKKRWLTRDEFTELLGLCQFLPGGNVMNLSVAVGNKFHGWKGGAVSLAGIVAIPTVIVVVLADVLHYYQHYPMVINAFKGLSAAAAGLLLNTALDMLLPFRKDVQAVAVVVITCIAMLVFHYSLLVTLVVLLAANFAFTWGRIK
jgi:chromate transporter